MKVLYLIFVLISTNCFAQKKFQYITVEPYFNGETLLHPDSLKCVIDTTGLDNNLKQQLKDYANPWHNHKLALNKWFNFLGNLGWEFLNGETILGRFVYRFKKEIP